VQCIASRGGARVPVPHSWLAGNANAEVGTTTPWSETTSVREETWTSAPRARKMQDVNIIRRQRQRHPERTTQLLFAERTKRTIQWVSPPEF